MKIIEWIWKARKCFEPNPSKDVFKLQWDQSCFAVEAWKLPEKAEEPVWESKGQSNDDLGLSDQEWWESPAIPRIVNHETTFIVNVR